MAVMMNQQLLFMGGGHMASALIGGLIEAGLPAHQIQVCDPNESARQRLSEHFGVGTLAALTPQTEPADAVIIAVKPQVLAAVLPDVAGVIHPGQLVISTVAGARLDTLQAGLDESAAIVRSMPNTPALMGAGMTGLVAGEGVTGTQRQHAEAIMASVGQVLWFADEADLDAVTAVSGSGPAYFFALAEHLTAAAVRAGLAPEQARQLVQQTAAGAGQMMAHSELDAGALRAQVTSPGGTTEAALAVLDQGQFATLIEQAVQAAMARARALSEDVMPKDVMPKKG
jgi:pyrroline-5-carboxylate reductase